MITPSLGGIRPLGTLIARRGWRALTTLGQNLDLRRKPLDMPKHDADRLDKAVADLVKHGHDDLPEGPPSPLGGDVRPNLLEVRPEREIHRLAKLGREIVDKRLAVRNRGAA